MRFAMTAKTLVRERAAAAVSASNYSSDGIRRDSEEGEEQGDDDGGGRGIIGIREITARNVAKVTRFRENGEAELEREVRRLETMKGLMKHPSSNNNNNNQEVEYDDDDYEDEDEDGSYNGTPPTRSTRTKPKKRAPWEPFHRMRQRQREKADEERPLSAWERRDMLRPKRDPDSGRRPHNMVKRKEMFI